MRYRRAGRGSCNSAQCDCDEVLAVVLCRGAVWAEVLRNCAVDQLLCCGEVLCCAVKRILYRGLVICYGTGIVR